jgi:hypothetical protein
VSYSIPCGVLIVEKVDGVGDKASGDTTTVDVQTLLKPFWNISQRFMCFTDTLGLFSTSVGLSGVLGCQMTD